MSRELELTGTRPQLEFYDLDAKYKLFVGGYGSGKTFALEYCVCLDIHDGRKADVAVFALTYKHLKLVLLRRISATLTEWGIKHTAKVGDMVIITHSPNLGNITFLSLDRPENIVSYEFYRSHIDEIDKLSLNKAEEAWNMIVARTRLVPATQTEENVRNRVSAYTTPEGFHFAYKMWVSNPGKQYQKVHAPSYSNPKLPISYIQGLRETYPEYLATAYIEGQFVNMTSGTVYRSFDRKLHGSLDTYIENEVLVIGQDFNIDRMATTIYIRRPNTNPKNKAIYPTRLVAIDEISDAYNTPAVIVTLRERYPKSHIIVVPDSSGDNRSTIGGASESDIALLRNAGFEIRVEASNPRIKDRVMASNAAFEQGLVTINIEKCPRTVQCLEQQAYDKNGVPDKTSGVDHQNDATTYPIAHFYPIRRPVAQFPIAFR